MDLLVEPSDTGYDNAHGWRCVACGEILDLVIIQNRIHAKAQRFIRRKKEASSICSHDYGL
jgi:hypothetical protein